MPKKIKLSDSDYFEIYQNLKDFINLDGRKFKQKYKIETKEIKGKSKKIKVATSFKHELSAQNKRLLSYWSNRLAKEAKDSAAIPKRKNSQYKKYKKKFGKKAESKLKVEFIKAPFPDAELTGVGKYGPTFKYGKKEIEFRQITAKELLDEELRFNLTSQIMSESNGRNITIRIGDKWLGGFDQRTNIQNIESLNYALNVLESSYASKGLQIPIQIFYSDISSIQPEEKKQFNYIKSAKKIRAQKRKKK
jgi:hypothetical protein